MEKGDKTALVNLGQGKLAKKVYKDILQEPGKKISTALSTVVDVSNTVIWPIKWANERAKLYFESNIEKYKKRLQSISENEIVSVPSEIATPILDRFTYVSNDQLSSAFVELLCSASDENKVEFAHPGFIRIIDRISPDEAKILQYFKLHSSCAALSVDHFENPDIEYQYFQILLQATLIPSAIELNFPSNIGIYLDNLTSLGLINYHDHYFISLKDDFDLIKKEHRDHLKIFDKYDEVRLSVAKKETMGMFKTTDFGEMFLQACISTNTEDYNT